LKGAPADCIERYNNIVSDVEIHKVLAKLSTLYFC
jgi:hypothetical protein